MTVRISNKMIQKLKIFTVAILSSNSISIILLSLLFGVLKGWSNSPFSNSICCLGNQRTRPLIPSCSRSKVAKNNKN